MKPMLLSSLCLSEEISQLQLRRYISKSNGLLMTMRPSKEDINTNMFSKFMLHRIIGNLNGSSVVTQKRCGDITRNPQISQQPSKPYNSCSSSGKCSKFSHCTRTRYNSLFLGLPGNRRGAKKNAVPCYGTTICRVTCPSGVSTFVPKRLQNLVKFELCELFCDLMCWCTLIIEEFKLQEFVGPMYRLFLYIINRVLLLVSCGFELNICFQLH